MRYLIFSLPAFMVFLLSACTGDQSQQRSAETKTDSAEAAASRALTAPAAAPAPPPCAVAGDMLDGNWLFLREKELMLAIIADSSTYDRQYGPGHRVLVLYDTRSCRQLERHVLPVNKSPDFSYRIAEITYNNQSQLTGVKAFNNIYVYDVANRKLLPGLEPKFKTQRMGVDAQSGMIRRLEVWEDYLVGYAQDFGAFVFSLRDENNPQAVLPFSEYKSPEDEFISLFLLPSGDRYQALLPVFRRESEDFEVNPVFATPQPVNLPKSISAVGNRFAIFRMSGPDLSPALIDLSRREQIALPPDLSSASDARIIDWLKTR